MRQPAALICLDLQRARLIAAASPESVARTIAACRWTLDQARHRRWPVLHVHRREASPEASRPIPGLEPRPSEAVFVRHGPSAFSHRAFSQTAQAMGGPLALIGFSLCDSILATAFAAVDRDLAVEVVRDAVAVDANDESALRQAMAAPIGAMGPLARIIESRDLFEEDVATLVAANTP